MKLMKSLLAVQMCMILTATQAFALAGGPVYESAASYVGDYSGSLVGAQSEVTGESNAVGLYSLGVPDVGLSSGPAYLFSDGRVFVGTITALVNPDGSITGVISAGFGFSVVVPGPDGATVVTSITSEAVGNFEAAISTESSVSSVNNVNANRIVGTAEIDISSGEDDPIDGSPIIVDSITFQVTGFQQSTRQSISSNTVSSN